MLGMKIFFQLAGMGITRICEKKKDMNLSNWIADRLQHMFSYKNIFQNFVLSHATSQKVCEN
jgi:hypothetical protein